MQGLNRIADLFGKLNGNNQVRTVEDLLDYSRQRQQKYFQEERNKPGSEWYQKSSNNLDTYLENETKVLKHTLKWLETLGVSWPEVIRDFNQSLLFVSPDENYTHMEGHLSYGDQAKEV